MISGFLDILGTLEAESVYRRHRTPVQSGVLTSLTSRLQFVATAGNGIAAGVATAIADVAMPMRKPNRSLQYFLAPNGIP
jgi:hypothetical protein